MNVATVHPSVSYYEPQQHHLKTQATGETEATYGSSTASFDWSLEDEDLDLRVLPLHLAQEDISAYYDVSPEILGQGHYGTVRKCVQRATGQTFAVKVIRKTYDQLDVLRREIELLQQVRGHPGIVEVVDTFEDATDFYIVTELCNGGELYDFLAGKMERRVDMEQPLFAEAQAAKILNAILESVAYLHDRNIVHRDLKPENFLLHNGSLKLIDFGLSIVHDPEHDAPLSDLVGTPFYLAPEVFMRKRYNYTCDMWSIGVMAYILLVGRPPFIGETNEEILASIRKGHFTFEGVQLSEEAQDFVKSLLKRDPRRRSSAAKAMEHPFILNHLN